MFHKIVVTILAYTLGREEYTQKVAAAVADARVSGGGALRRQTKN